MLTAARQRLVSERGFTLVELLVVMLIGIIVLSAVLGLTEVSGRASNRVTDRVETVQRGRVAMEHIVQALRSQLCLDSVTPPIVTGGDSSINFYTDVDNTSDFLPQRRVITYDPTGQGSIVEQIYKTTSTTAPWAFPASPTSTRTLLTNVTQVPTVPFLRYYSFDTSTALTTPLSTDTTSATLPSNSIAKVVRIDVSFQALPSSNNQDVSRRSTVQTSVYLRNTDYSDKNTTSNRTWGPRCS